ncbi:MAG: hypothetical protein ACXVDZ_16970 [Bacteroidia bacterium]
MERNIYEIEKEYKCTVDIFTIRGRVLKMLDKKEYPYTWEIDHYYKPHQNAVDVYIPNGRFFNTAEESRSHLFSYVNSFTTQWGIKKNEDY